MSTRMEWNEKKNEGKNIFNVFTCQTETGKRFYLKIKIHKYSGENIYEKKTRPQDLFWPSDYRSCWHLLQQMHLVFREQRHFKLPWRNTSGASAPGCQNQCYRNKRLLFFVKKLVSLDWTHTFFTKQTLFFFMFVKVKTWNEEINFARKKNWNSEKWAVISALKTFCSLFHTHKKNLMKMFFPHSTRHLNICKNTLTK